MLIEFLFFYQEMFLENYFVDLNSNWNMRGKKFNLCELNFLYVNLEKKFNLGQFWFVLKMF